MINYMTTGATLISTVIGAIIGFVFGEMDGLVIAVITFISIDYLTGIIKAAMTHTLSPEVGFKGLLRKVAILICILVGNVIDKYVLGGDSAPCRSVVILFFISNEGLSILDNLAAIGIPIPKKIVDILDKIKEGQ